MAEPKTIIPLSKGTILRGSTYVYHIERMAGHGAFGITYVASTHMKVQGPLGMMEANVKVAIKEFYCGTINGREGNTVTCSNEKIFTDYKRMFLREARNLRKIQHPHIVKVLEAFEANNTFYYSMEYLDGGSLDDYLSEWDGLPEQEALTLIAQVGDALQFMHDNRMLHLDMKPKNIMRRKIDGSLLLIDFGLSKQFNEKGEPDSTTSIGLGTPGYAPVEQANYQKGDGFPVTLDVYALGATLYKVLVGHIPGTASDILNDGFPEDELRKRKISNKTITALRHAMEPRKKGRTANVKEFMKELGVGNNEEETTLVAEETTVKEKDITIVKKTVCTEQIVVPPDTQRITISYKEFNVSDLSGFEVLVIPSDIRIVHYCQGEPNVQLKTFSKRRFRELMLKIDALNLLCSSMKPANVGKRGGQLQIHFLSAEGKCLKKLSTQRMTEDGYWYLTEDSSINFIHKIKQLLPELMETNSEAKPKPTPKPKPKPTPKPTPKPAPVPKSTPSFWNRWTITLAVGLITALAVMIWQNYRAPFPDLKTPGTAIDLGLSVKWADRNVGASSPSDYGSYFAWGETSMKSDYSPSNSVTYEKGIRDIAGNSNHDAARANWGESWRLPTEAECHELKEKCTWTRITQNGHNGYKVVGPNGNNIFLPAAGWRDGTSPFHNGENGYYWSSTPTASDTGAYYLDCVSNYDVDCDYRYYGFTVRPVSE